MDNLGIIQGQSELTDIRKPYCFLWTIYGQFMDNFGTIYGRKKDQSIGWNFAVVHKICGR